MTLPWTARPGAESPPLIPFAPLPGEFHGPYLALRFRFYYNPQKGDMD